MKTSVPELPKDWGKTKIKKEKSSLAFSNLWGFPALLARQPEQGQGAVKRGAAW